MVEKKTRFRAQKKTGKGKGQGANYELHGEDQVGREGKSKKESQEYGSVENALGGKERRTPPRNPNNSSKRPLLPSRTAGRGVKEEVVPARRRLKKSPKKGSQALGRVQRENGRVSKLVSPAMKSAILEVRKEKARRINGG